MFSLLAVLVFYVVWSTARFFVYIEYSTPEQLDSPWGGPALWIALPQLLSSFLMVVIGALVYGRHRLRSRSGALVVLALPVLVFLLDFVTGVFTDAPGNVLFLRFAAVSVGIGAAFWLVLPRGREIRGAV
ncbi:hypothetical protein [Halostreptopolyspora alba]|uniref:hypothetical protein n=1 Tax=Halostreptopolyspora alba TaxID=2487137 RepID=UPI0011CDD6F8